MFPPPIPVGIGRHMFVLSRIGDLLTQLNTQFIPLTILTPLVSGITHLEVHPLIWVVSLYRAIIKPRPLKPPPHLYELVDGLFRVHIVSSLQHGWIHKLEIFDDLSERLQLLKSL